jgi:hypothetical protein
MDHVGNIQKILELYRSLDPIKHEGIIRAVEFHHTTRRFNNFGRLAVLAYFVIIEMLLTHNPGDREIGDSISHQLKTKISLLSGRLSQKLDYQLFEPSTSYDRIWGLLYSYRSDIAHGEHIEFAKKFRILKTEEDTWRFIASATRILLEHALKEPDLIIGLKPI